MVYMMNKKDRRKCLFSLLKTIILLVEELEMDRIYSGNKTPQQKPWYHANLFVFC